MMFSDFTAPGSGPDRVAAASFDENLDALLTRKRKLMRDTLIPPEATMDQDRDELFKATVG